MLPIDCMDDEPTLARFHHRLASFRRLIRFDHRGIGLSDSVAPSSPPTLEQWMHDALAVMDAAGSLRAAVFAPRTRRWWAILLAATHPDRVSSLVIVNGTARIPAADDYPEGIAQELLDRVPGSQLRAGRARSWLTTRSASSRRPSRRTRPFARGGIRPAIGARVRRPPD